MQVASSNLERSESLVTTINTKQQHYYNNKFLQNLQANKSTASIG
jgi:hypothetical protein